jgi:hypothetical protein
LRSAISWCRATARTALPITEIAVIARLREQGLDIIDD